ncbi:MAG: pyridoxamine 5'-phosphate oxidase family protein [Acetobacteraceae bacterium]
MHEIADPQTLRAHYGEISALAQKKVLHALDRHARAFIALSPFVMLATADASGNTDASPRGDSPGFVTVRDERTLLIPDRPGNNRVDSFANMLATGGVGLLFLVPGIDETLRVNGRARLLFDPDLLAAAAVHGRLPRAVLEIAVREVFFHCGKALKRAALWDPQRHQPRKAFPSLGRVIAEQTGAMDVAAADAAVAESYRDRLY